MLHLSYNFPSSNKEIAEYGSYKEIYYLIQV